jgi:dTMP kinase
LNEHALAPDVTLFLDVDLATAARRRAARGGEAELYEVDSHQRRVTAQYRKAIASRKRQEPIFVLDGTLSPQEVTEQAFELIRGFLGRQPKALGS